MITSNHNQKPYIFPLVLIVLLSFPLCFCPSTHGQEFAPNEVTVSGNLQGYNTQTSRQIGSGSTYITNGRKYDFSIPTFTYTRNLSPSLGLVATVTPSTPMRYTGTYGSGHEMLAMGGVRTGWRGRHFDLYGQTLAGAASYSCDQWNWKSDGNSYVPYSNCKRQSHFALEYGVVTEYHLNHRYSIHADLGNLQIMHFDQIVSRYQNGSPFLYHSAEVSQHLDARIGITRSFGNLRKADPEPVPQKKKWDAGILFALQPRIQKTFEYLNTYPSWGVWTSYNFGEHISWDTALLHSGRNPGKMETIDYQDGGRSFEALSGAKIGIRRDHMGYFLKVRPGIITFGETERKYYQASNGEYQFDNGMFTHFVLDTGAVYEVYPSHHSILRFEAGDAHIFYLSKTITYPGDKWTEASYNTPRLFIGFGTGVRF
jgi:hypothetical protein